MSLVYGSVCSGIEAATVAWHSLGWRAAFYSEIEPFPAALLQHYYPQIPNHGDLNGFRSWPEEKIDLLVGGTPCQSFSVAGLRRGLADPRGNLMLTFLALADRLKPRWLVWENVPGVLSSGGGRDFGSFLGALGQLGYGFAYRVLDAQYFGVPQRRRRVFVVGCLGDWRRAAAVLFERHSLQGNPAPSREAGQGVAGTFKACAGSGGWSNSADHAAAGYMQAVAPTISARTKGAGGLGTDFDCDGGLIPAMHSELSPALKARDSKGPSSDGDGDGAILVPMVSHALRAEGFDASEDGTGRGTPLVPIAMNLRGREGGAMPELDEVASLRAASGGSSRSYVAFAQNQRDEVRQMEVAGALASEPGMKQQTYVAFDLAQITSAANRTRVSAELPASTLNAAGQMHVAQPMQVRRLTPRECERLQGFPDDYTLVEYRKKPAADGPRYKALGNSMAVPVMAWIGRRIALQDLM